MHPQTMQVRYIPLTTVDPKYSKETSIKVKHEPAKSTCTQKKFRTSRKISGRSSKKPVSTATTSAPIILLRFLESCESTNGQIFDIVPTQEDRYIKTKKQLVGYVGPTYSKITKKSIETLTYKLKIIVGPIITTKQVTDPNTNVVTAVNKLYMDLT